VKGRCPRPLDDGDLGQALLYEADRILNNQASGVYLSNKPSGQLTEVVTKPKPWIRAGHLLLSQPTIYDTFQSAVGAKQHRNHFISFITCQNEFTSVLDLGCGTGFLLSKLVNVQNYVGVDSSQEYLNAASKIQTSTKTQFILGDLGSTDWCNQVGFSEPQLVLGMGIFHHLSDFSIRNVLSFLCKSLPKNSLLVSLDPTIDSETSKAATWIAKNDRGRYIRSKSELDKLFSDYFESVNFTKLKKQIRIPTDVIIGWNRIK